MTHPEETALREALREADAAWAAACRRFEDAVGAHSRHPSVQSAMESRAAKAALTEASARLLAAAEALHRLRRTTPVGPSFRASA